MSAIRFELTRMVRRRSTYYVAAGGLFAALLSLFGNAQSTVDDVKAGSQTVVGASQLLVGLAFSLTLFAAIIGALSVTRDVRDGMLGTLFLFSRNRASVLVAKAISALAAGLVLAVTGVAGCWLLAHALLAHKGYTLDLGPHPLGLLASQVAVITLSSVLGVAVGALTRSSLVAVLALVLWTAMIEAALIHYFPHVGRWLPGGAEAAIVSDPSLPERFGVLAGCGLWAAWLAVALIGAIRRNEADLA